jgi:TonB-dependent SusC/RagA subfamily outer membrane receptor
LKDADATAIYGSGASNGEILITTKKGKAEPTKLLLDVKQRGSFSASPKHNYPNNRPINAAEFQVLQ